MNRYKTLSWKMTICYDQILLVNVVEHLKSSLTHEFDQLIIHQFDPLSRNIRGIGLLFLNSKWYKLWPIVYGIREFFGRQCDWKLKSPVSFRFTGNYILKEIFGVWNGFDANTRFIQLFDDASFGRFQGWIGISAQEIFPIYENQGDSGRTFIFS